MDGPTYKRLINSTHYINLGLAEQKLGIIISNLQKVRTSLAFASGTEIEKVKKDLKNVKDSFTSIKESVIKRKEKMESLAKQYDKVYEKIQIGCSTKSLYDDYESESRNKSGSYIIIFKNEARVNGLIERYYESVSIDSNTGFIYLTLRVKVYQVNEETGFTFFWDDDFREVSRKEISNTTQKFKVTLKTSWDGQGHSWNLNDV